MIPLSEHKVVDSHSHLLLPEKETKRFEQYWNLSRLEIDSQHLKNLLNYRLMLKELGKLLLNDPNGPEDTIISTRNRLYKEDPSRYIRQLFEAARIETVLLDTGVPNMETYGYAIPVEAFAQLLPPSVETRCIVRIEPIIYRLFQNATLSFGEFQAAFERELEESIRIQHAVALKTTIAYHTGIGIRAVLTGEASKAYATYRKSTVRTLEAEKQVRDYLVVIAMEKCIQHDLPIQIHTGIGDAPVHDLRGANPLLLYEILSDEHFRRVKIVLEHGGYPYLAEAGSLANMYPNVWVSLSSMIAFASTGVSRSLAELFEMCPLTKIMYGSDAYGVPEIFWFSSIYFKKCLGGVLEGFIRDDVMSEDYATYVATRILSDNAKGFYKLDQESELILP